MGIRVIRVIRVISFGTRRLITIACLGKLRLLDLSELLGIRVIFVFRVINY